MCAVFSLARINHSSSWRKGSLFFPCKLYYEGQTLVTVQRVMSFLHAHFITTTVLWCWTTSNCNGHSWSVHTHTHSPLALPQQLLASGRRTMLQGNARGNEEKNLGTLYKSAHSPCGGKGEMPSINNQTSFDAIRQGDNNINVSSTYFSNKTCVATCFLPFFFSFFLLFESLKISTCNVIP